MMVHRQGLVSSLRSALVIAAALAAILTDGGTNRASAQALSVAPADAPAPVAQGQPISPEQMKAMQEAQAKAAAAGQPQPGQPGAKPGEDKKKSEGEGDKKKDEAAGDSVKRPETPPKAPDPRDFEVVLDEHGKVPPFNFIGQPWPDVLQWLANLSKSSLDWQEVPNGYLNLTTQRSYTVDEVHDLVNQALTARGFTSIKSGEVLSIFKIEKLDPAVVRQVNEEDLYNLKRYDFVKVSFELPTLMEVDKAKDDVKQVLSPNAKVFPLVTTKRLLVIDSVANLRTVSELLNEERMFQDGQIVPTEFVLQYARPEQVIEILYVILGVDPKAKPAQMSPEQQAQQAQMMQQMQQQGGKPPKMAAQQQGPAVHLAYNRRRNSILANAPPAELRKIKRTIDYLDVPPHNGSSAPIVGDPNERTLFKYQMITMDPNELKLTLEEIGELDPLTHLRADNKSKILFARATADDHKKIASLKDELDGTGRGLHQIWLPRRLPADAVAGTVLALMGGQEEEEDDNNDFPFYFSFRRNNDDEKPKKGFRVDADIENNRILLWANDAEFKEVERFVAELSKASPAQQAQRTVRTIDASDPEDTAKILEQLRKIWPTLGENELIINDERPKEAEPEKKKADETPKPAETADRQAAARPLSRPHFQLAQLTSEAPAESADASADVAESADEPATEIPAVEVTKAPITITVTKDGRIVLTSKDTDALDRLQQFIGQTVPQGQRYKVFKIKYADVYDVYLNLKEFYEDELKGERGQVLDWWGFTQDTGPKEGSLLSKRPLLRLIWDPDSNTILVANASASQLAEIEHLINEYDQPQPEDAATERVTKPIKIQYSKASTIVASLKEVFRDLLSSKDKEFDAKDGQKSTSGSSGITVLRYSMGGSSESNSTRSAPVKVGFQGALSLGADDISNTILVSAQQDVFNLVNAMILKLDEEAAPKTTLHVHRVTGNIRAESLQKALDQAVGQAWLGNRPEQTGSSGDNDNDNNRRDRDRDRDRGERRRDRDNN